MVETHNEAEKRQGHVDSLVNSSINLRQDGNTWRDVAEVLLEDGKTMPEYVELFGGGKKANKETANKLIEEWKWWIVAENLEKFEWIDHKDIANKLIELWMWLVVAWNLDKFEWLDHKEIADKLIKKWMWASVMKNLDKFKWISYWEKADMLI